LDSRFFFVVNFPSQTTLLDWTGLTDPVDGKTSRGHKGAAI